MKRDPVQTTSSSCTLWTDDCDGTFCQAEGVGGRVGIGDGVGVAVELGIGVTEGSALGEGVDTMATGAVGELDGVADGLVLEQPAVIRTAPITKRRPMFAVGRPIPIPLRSPNS